MELLVSLKHFTISSVLKWVRASLVINIAKIIDVFPNTRNICKTKYDKINRCAWHQAYKPVQVRYCNFHKHVKVISSFNIMRKRCVYTDYTCTLKINSYF